MNPVVNLIMGALVAIGGISWYIFSDSVASFMKGVDPVTSLQIIFSGLTGLVLIIIGLFLIWINIEEIRDLGIGGKKKKLENV